MRLWPLSILPQLPRQQLLGQHRECCALRGKGWNRKHATVDYVFSHPYIWLFIYHKNVMEEMLKRGYHFSSDWGYVDYRGKSIGYQHDEFTDWTKIDTEYLLLRKNVYPEHNAAYLDECISNLARKGIKITRPRAA